MSSKLRSVFRMAGHMSVAQNKNEGKKILDMEKENGHGPQLQF
jgi:hypothetical protein